jgi:hypothetical protein
MRAKALFWRGQKDDPRVTKNDKGQGAALTARLRFVLPAITLPSEREL